MKKKIILGIAAAGTALAMLPLFAAFEAHVINVTAKIENALSVPTDPINFGTVFPQEQLDRFLSVALSQSFLDEANADDVEYIIRQKPKCGVTNEGGTVLIGPTWTGHVVPTVDNPSTTGVDESNGGTAYTIDCEADKPVLEGTPTYGALPSLCPYLSKHEETPDPVGEVLDNDGLLNAFHHAFDVVGGVVDWNDTPGRLARSESDTADRWKIDLKVPCFGGFCAQDWDDFVTGINSGANPDEYTQPIENEHKVFGCNLWIEVTGVSRVGDTVPTPTPTPTPTPIVGANLNAFVDPTSCNVTVDPQNTALNTITEAIAQATTGQAVCVPDGTFNEDVNINKSISLIGSGATSTTVINGVIGGQTGAVSIAADNVTVSGFAINGVAGSIAAMRFTGAHSGATISYNKITGGSGGGAVDTVGGQSNHTFSNNEFVGVAGSQLVYINGLASNNVVSTNVDFLNNTFSGTAGFVLGQEAGASQIQQNKFSTASGGLDIEDWGLGNLINQNNFNDAGDPNVKHSENVQTGENGITNAENNWWGDADPSDGDVIANADVDFTPFAAVAFPEN